MPETYNRNIAILGYSAVGKTSISRYFKTNEFFLEYNPNPSQVWATKTKVDKVNFDILVYDTAAMDDQTPIPREARVGIHSYILVFAVNSRHSFEVIQAVRNKLQIEQIGVKYILVGNKIDLEDDRCVTKTEAMQKAREWGVPYVECSAKLGKDIDTVFHTLIKFSEQDTDVFESSCCCSIF